MFTTEHLYFLIIFHWSCDKTESYIGETIRHVAVSVQEHLSGQLWQSASKDCHSCSISYFYTLAQVNTDL